MTMPSRTTRDLILLLIPWLALPLLAWMLLDVRESLPERVAVHFGFGGAPDRWASRETFIAVSLGVLALVLAIFTARSLRARASGGFYPLLASQYILVGVVASAIWQVVRFSRDGTRLSTGTLLGGVVLAVVAAAFARRWKRT
jgi:hypothetical protein